jgi:putative chitinase
MEITLELLINVGVGPKTAARILQPLKDTCVKYSINTPQRITAYLSELEHESGEFFYTEELASGVAYEGRKDLGNLVKGDGVNYKGRGLIQITGKLNYALLSKEFGIDFVKNPDLLGAKNFGVCTDEQVKWAVMSSGWYWNKCQLNAISDKLNLAVKVSEEPNLSTYKLITLKINGGYNGLLDRQIQFEQIRTFLNKIKNG